MNTESPLVFDGDRFAIRNGNILQGYPKKVSALSNSLTSAERGVIERAEYELLSENALFLLENKDKIFADSRMFLAPVTFTCGGCISGSNGTATLGSYLEWWMIRGSESLIISFAGSPLTGSCRSTSVAPDGQLVRVVNSGFSSLAHSYRDVHSRYKTLCDKYEAYSLWEAIQRLKGRVPEYGDGFRNCILMCENKALTTRLAELEETRSKLEREVQSYKDKLKNAVNEK